MPPDGYYEGKFATVSTSLLQDSISPLHGRYLYVRLANPRGPLVKVDREAYDYFAALPGYQVIESEHELNVK